MLLTNGVGVGNATRNFATVIMWIDRNRTQPAINGITLTEVRSSLWRMRDVKNFSKTKPYENETSETCLATSKASRSHHKPNGRVHRLLGTYYRSRHRLRHRQGKASIRRYLASSIRRRCFR